MSGWINDDHVERLKSLWVEGLSCSQIAERLNRSFSDASYTRNAVIGKASRLGLEGRSRPSVPRRVVHVPPTRPKQPMPKGVMVLNPVKGGDVATAARVENMAAREKPAENVLQMARAFRPLPGHEPVALADLKASSCRWPVGLGADGIETFCGCSPDGESPYCRSHRAAATVPTSKPHELARSLRRYAA